MNCSGCFDDKTTVHKYEPISPQTGTRKLFLVISEYGKLVVFYSSDGVATEPCELIAFSLCGAAINTSECWI
jgi:hypothetical protein